MSSFLQYPASQWVLWVIHDCTQLYINLKYLLFSVSRTESYLPCRSNLIFLHKKVDVWVGSWHWCYSTDTLSPFLPWHPTLSCSVCWLWKEAFWPSLLTPYAGQWPRNVQNTMESSNVYSEFQAEQNQQKLIEKLESVDQKRSVVDLRESRPQLPLRCPAAHFCWVNVSLSLCSWRLCALIPVTRASSC